MKVTHVFFMVVMSLTHVTWRHCVDPFRDTPFQGCDSFNHYGTAIHMHNWHMSKACFLGSTPFVDVGVFSGLWHVTVPAISGLYSGTILFFVAKLCREYANVLSHNFGILQKPISEVWTRLRFRSSKSNFRIRTEAMGPSTRTIANTFLYS
jgi:hypothetical protein